MIVEKLHLQNFRGFGEEPTVLRFGPGLNIFVGPNGAGKSSVLDLLAIFLNLFIQKLTGVNFREKEYYITDSDIRKNCNETINRITIKNEFAEASGIGNVFDWEIKKDIFKRKNDHSNLNQFIKIWQDRLLTDRESSIPICKYFGAERKHFASTVKNRRVNNSVVSQFDSYLDSFSKQTTFEEFIEWYIAEENVENREKVKRGDLKYSNFKLDVIREAMRIAAKYFPKLADSRIGVSQKEIQNGGNDRNSLTFIVGDKELSLEQLSDGEKSVILVIADIAYRLVIANPHTEHVLAGKGIILIDEIELHLHPAWQRNILPCLQEVFPGLQFFITTHSPQVLSDVRDYNLWLFDDFVVKNISTITFGKDANFILRHVFNLFDKPQNAQAAFDELYKIMEEGDNEAFTRVLNELRKVYGDDDPELQRISLIADLKIEDS